MNNKVKSSSINLVFGLLCTFIGFVNCFWGNDPFLGYLITLISFVFYVPLFNLISEYLKPNFLLIVKVILIVLIIWASLGVGELFDKIEFMKVNFPLPKY